MCSSMVDIHSATAEIRRGKKRKKIEKVWLTPTARVPRRETRWNLLGCPKLANGSQPLVGRSSPHYEDMWWRYCCLTSFFQLSIRALIEDRARQSCQMVHTAQVANFWRFLHPVFSSSRVQHVSDLHLKFALRPHHVWKYGRPPISDGWV